MRAFLRFPWLMPLAVILTPALVRAQQDSTRLDTVKVVAKRPSTSPRIQEFEARLNKWPGAVFLDARTIDQRHAARVTDLFRNIASVKVVDNNGMRAVASTRAPKLQLAPKMPWLSGGRAPSQATRDGVVGCLLRVGVDGMLRETEFDINSLVPEEIAGIEIFPGSSSLPARYNGMSGDKGCGLILIWTKAGEDSRQ